MKLYCFTCNKEIEVKETLNKTNNGIIQIKGACPDCGRWIKWVPYADSMIVKDLLNKKFNEQ